MAPVKMAQSMREAAAALGEESLMGGMLMECAATHDGIGAVLADFEESVEEKTIAPMTSMLKLEIRLAIESRKNLTRSRNDVDSARAKLLKASEDKVVLADEELGAAKEEYDILLGVCEDRLNEFGSRDAEHIAPLIDYMEALDLYHRLASELLASTVAKLRVRKANASSPTVFGRPLVEHLAAVDRNIPHVVDACVKEIRRRGMTSEGIFRLSGNSVTVKRLRAAFNAEQAVVNFESDSDWEDVEINAVAGVLKLYFRELPEPLLTFELYRDWINAGSLRDHNDRLNAVRDVVARLPQQNATILFFLMSFLHELAENHDSTKMHPSNLSIVFGPTLLWSPTPDDVTSIMETGPQSACVEAMIAYSDWIFEDIAAKTAASVKHAANSPVPAKKQQPSAPAGGSDEAHKHTATATASATASAPAAAKVPPARPATAARKPVAAAPAVDLLTGDIATESAPQASATDSPPAEDTAQPKALAGAAATPFAGAVKLPIPGAATGGAGALKRPPVRPPAPVGSSNSTPVTPLHDHGTDAPLLVNLSDSVAAPAPAAAAAAAAAPGAVVPPRPKPQPRPKSTYSVTSEDSSSGNTSPTVQTPAPAAAAATAAAVTPTAAPASAAKPVPPRPQRPSVPAVNEVSAAPATPSSPGVMPDGTPIPAVPPRRPGVKRTDSDMGKGPV
ncbi:hypothetical protein, variant [Capsaspora owczarzaki ATCC 30864]|nr:hypothetical protein, variant [Capsaspora owczarzaki ATCC 30864]